MEFPMGLRYTQDHEWVRLEGDLAVVGITDYAQRELGDIVFVELPAKGTAVSQGGGFGTIEAVKTVSDLFAPAGGTVAEVNEELKARPEVVNRSPYGDGWMIKIRVSDPSEVDRLMDAAAYRAHVGEGS